VDFARERIERSMDQMLVGGQQGDGSIYRITSAADAVDATCRRDLVAGSC
jgi:hypothetical protein